MHNQQAACKLFPFSLAEKSQSGEIPLNFISDVAVFSPDGHPDLMLMVANYNLSCFSENLFNTFSIPFPEHLNHAVKKRRAEYLASRVCIRHALSLWGIEGFILHNDADRAPIWPAGMVGALSHTDGFISLLTGYSSSGKWPGIDCEKVIEEANATSLQAIIINADEKEVMRLSGLSDGVALTVAFSLKESLYKALFPHLRQFMDFEAAEIVDCNVSASNILLRLTRHLSPEFPTGRLFTGHAQVTDDRVLSWIVVTLT